MFIFDICDKNKKIKKWVFLCKKFYLIKILKWFKYLYLWWLDVMYLVLLLSGNYFYYYIIFCFIKRNIKKFNNIKNNFNVNINL